MSRRQLRFQIVMPSLNQGQYIGAAIDSVLRQAGDVPAVELIVVDGLSNDGSAEIAEEVASSSVDVRVVAVSEGDEGQSDAINKGIALGSGDIVSWLNADDMLLPGALGRVAAYFDDDDVSFVYGDTRYVDGAGRSLFELREQDFSRNDLLWGPCYISQPSTFVARWAWNQVGGLRTDLHYAMDLDLWLRLSRIGRVVHVRDVLSEFRVHSQSKSVAAAGAARREAREVRRANVLADRGQAPSTTELELRRFLIRSQRKLARYRSMRREAT